MLLKPNCGWLSQRIFLLNFLGFFSSSGRIGENTVRKVGPEIISFFLRRACTGFPA